MNTLNMVKLRNQLLKIRPTLKVELRNVRINGVLQGCSGFVSDPNYDKPVYVSTDRNHGTLGDGTLRYALYRLARDTKDYTGERNHFADDDALAGRVVALLDSQNATTPFEVVAVMDVAINSGRMKIVRVG